MSWRSVALVLALVFLDPGRVDGQELWGAVAVPGGAAAARRSLSLQASPTRPDELLLLDYADRYAALRNRPAADLADRYFRYVAALAAHASAMPDGCALPEAGVANGASDRARECLELLGLRLRERQGAYAAERDETDAARQRRDWLAAAGIDTAHLLERLNAGERARVDLDESVLPLPLPGFWAAVLPDGDGPLLAAIARREELALLYRGLFELDDDTLAYLAAASPLTRRVMDEAPRSFAVFGRSIRIREGVVHVPGGDDFVETWEQLVGRPVNAPESFAPELLRADNGRLAYFYDAVARLDPVRQAAVLGAHLQGEARRDHVTRIYQAFRSFDQYWSASDEPFQLRAFDPAIALAFTEFKPDGTVGPDWWASLLEHVAGSDSWPDRPEQTTRRLRETRADAGWLVSWLFDRPAEASRRFELLRYLQRQFPDAAPDAAPAVHLALRTQFDEPALALSLERMGVRDAALIGALGRRARDLTGAASPDHVRPPLVRWQAAFGWLEQLQRHRPDPPAALEALLRSLAQATPTRAEGEGAVTAWLVELLLPARGATADQSEARMLEAMLGAGPAPAARVVWEGLEYRVQRHRPVLRTVAAIRASQPGPRLDDLAALHVARRALEAGPESLEALAVIAAAVRARIPTVQVLVEHRLAERDVVSDLERVGRDLSRIERERDLDRATRDLPRLARVIEAVADVLLPQMLYALAAAPTTRPAALYADGWRQHAVDVQLVYDDRPWTRLVWDAPRSSPADRGDASIHGSWLSLDVALADARLRDVASDELLAPPMLATPDRLAMVQSLALTRPGAGGMDAEGPQLAATVARGRARVEAWGASSTPRAQVRAALEAAGVDARRQNLILFAIAQAPGAALAWLSQTELHWLGGGAMLPAAWGAAGRQVDGCLCFAPVEPWITGWLQDRAGSGRAGAALMDLPLRLAELLDGMGLPASLVPLALESAMRDWVDGVWQIVPSDGTALAEFPVHLSARRLEDYLLALVADGTLAVADGGVAWNR